MNALLSAIQKPFQWRLLALIDKPFDHDPSSQEVRQRLESLSPGEYLKLMALVKILAWINRLGGNHVKSA